MKCGYAYLVDAFGILALSLTTRANVSSKVNKLIPTETGLLVPPRMAPAENDMLGHLVFAVKHEGINLEVLNQVLPHIEMETLQKAVDATPSSAVLRKLAWLLEETTGRQLQYDNPAGNYVEFFDSDKYFTGPIQRIRRWRILYNGIGPLSYCPCVCKTNKINEAAISAVFEKLKDLERGTPIELWERLRKQAFWIETESSSEIEHESVPDAKVFRLIKLLQEADACQELDEAALCELQNALIVSPTAQASSYRQEQNWLSMSLSPGIRRITYIPPTPEMLSRLMPGFLTLANSEPVTINPLISAAVVSFGFVYLHPFMDGNGRLSRFLIHWQLVRSGALSQDTIVPVSAALLKHTAAYANALEGFSEPCRELWEATPHGENDYDFHFKGSEAAYRYWDATAQCEFLLEMIRRTVEEDLPEEIRFLKEYDRVYRDLNSRFDVVQPALDYLVRTAVSTGRVSNNLKKKYEYKVEPGFFEELEKLVNIPPALETTSE